MARQTEKLSEKFAEGGDKNGEKEQLFFAEDSRVDPEWAVIDLLRSQVDVITDVINANDEGSGSFASDIKNITNDSGSFSTRVTNLTLASGSFSTRATTNDAKVSLVGGAKTALSFGEMITKKVEGSKNPTYSIVMTAVKEGVSKSVTLTLT